MTFDPEIPADGVALTEAHTEPATPRRRLRIYVAALLAAPFLYMAASFAIMRSDIFIARTQNPYLANMGYGLRLKNADCKVLIFGDSSAMVGVDPATVERATGLSTCNIGEYAGVMRLSGTMVLDRYLSRNQAPRYLVVLLSPNDLAPSWLHEGNYEAVLMRVREKPDLGLVYALMRHSDDILSVIGTSGRFALTWLIHRPLPPSVFREREELRGRFPDKSSRMTECMSDTKVNPPSREWINDLRKRYGSETTHVIVDVTPAPDCDPKQSTYEREFEVGTEMVDNQFQVYPTHWYTQSGHFHLGSPEGWGRLSNEVAGQIKQLQSTSGRR